MSFIRTHTFLPKDDIVGIAIDASYHYSARLSFSKKKITVENLDVKPLDTPARVTVSVFPSTKTLVRPLFIGPIKPKELEAALPFEIEPLLPYPIEKCVIDKVCLESNEIGYNLQAFAALKEDIQSHLDAYSADGIDAEICTSKACALAHFSKLFFPEKSMQILIDIDSCETTIVLASNGKPHQARSHPTGLSSLALSEESLPELHTYLREIARILLSFENSDELPILFTGSATRNPELLELIATFLQRIENKLTDIPKDVRLASNVDQNSLCLYASSIGAALAPRYLEKNMQSVNFRTGEFTPRSIWKRYKPELMAYFSLAILCTIALFFYSQIELSKQNVRLVKKYNELLIALDKPIQADPTIDIEQELALLESTLQKATDDIALHPDVPRVSDLLAWLANHPNASVKINDNGDMHSLQLESLAYVMVKRPEKGKVKERYQVRVDLEFSSPSATLAREFHDALLAPNQFVDSKNELKWSVQRGRYKASFFLKDRTQYPHNIQTSYASDK
jgi:type IV pilus assembly protein PilM